MYSSAPSSLDSARGDSALPSLASLKRALIVSEMRKHRVSCAEKIASFIRCGVEKRRLVKYGGKENNKMPGTTTDSASSDESTFVTCETSGGMGNQLFQISTALAFAQSTGRRLLLARKNRSKSGCVLRSTYWDSIFRRFPSVTPERARTLRLDGRPTIELKEWTCAKTDIEHI